MKRERTKYESEAAMCAAFIAWAQLNGEWRAYAETEGWDILLVRVADGLQIGVQAKQTLNLEVFCQAVEGRFAAKGPDCRAVLAPWSKLSGQFYRFGQLLGVTVILAASPGEMDAHGFVRGSDGGSRPAFTPSLPEEPRDPRYFYDYTEWQQLCPDARCDVPEYVPDVIAGASAPVALTAWKVRAIKAAIILDKRGYLLRSDFKHLELSPSRWYAGWLSPSLDNRGHIATRQMPNLKAQHPTNYAQIEADYETWRPRFETSAPGTQADLLAGGEA